MTKTKNPNAKVVAGILLCLIVGGVIAIAGSDGGLRVGNIPLFAICAMLGFVLHWLVFVPSYALQTEHYFDLTGSLSFIGAILLANWLAPSTGLGDDLRANLLSFMVLAWALRLGAFLFMRVKRNGEDSRFREIKTRFLRFLFTWTLGGLWVLLTAAAALAAITSGRSIPLGLGAYIGGALWLVGFLFEAIADRQKSAFKANPENKGRFIKTGLWSISRHPNYFGEIALWVGVAIIAAPVLQGWQLMTLVSPLFVIFLLCRVSGIPLLEAQAEERWGDDPDYKRYVQLTPVLIPGIRTTRLSAE
jgi:steroid 5-alpha reductase family enzyme